MNLKILHALLFTLNPEGGWGLPGLLWGPPGRGKTAFIKDAARRYNMVHERLSPAERGEGQFGVVPVPQQDGYLHYPAPDWSKKFADRAGIIFLDEINTAMPAIQAPLLGLVQLRTLGSHTFGPHTRILAAANETQDAAGGWDLAPALANRFGHFEFEGFSGADWVAGFLGGFGDTEAPVIDAEAEETRVKNAWPNEIAQSRGLIAGFIKARPELLHRQPTNAAKASSRAWPSNRSVDYAAHALTAARIHNLSDTDTDTLLAGFVGQGWVGEFMTYRANVDLPDMAEVLDGKIRFTHDPRRLDRSMAVLSAGAALVVPAKAENRNERAKVLWQLMAHVAEDAADLIVPAGRALRNANPPLIGKAAGATDALAKLLPVFKAMGIT
jgi:hypothetical protein